MKRGLCVLLLVGLVVIGIAFGCDSKCQRRWFDTGNFIGEWDYIEVCPDGSIVVLAEVYNRNKTWWHAFAHKGLPEVLQPLDGRDFTSLELAKAEVEREYGNAN